MTDWTRLTNYIIDFFPDSTYSEEEIDAWAMESVPAWKFMDQQTKDDILGDWKEFIDSLPLPEEPDLPIPPQPPEPEKKGIGSRIKSWFKRRFKR